MLSPSLQLQGQIYDAPGWCPKHGSYNTWFCEACKTDPIEYVRENPRVLTCFYVGPQCTCGHETYMNTGRAGFECLKCNSFTSLEGGYKGMKLIGWLNGESHERHNGS